MFLALITHNLFIVEDEGTAVRSLHMASSSFYTKLIVTLPCVVALTNHSPKKHGLRNYDRSTNQFQYCAVIWRMLSILGKRVRSNFKKIVCFVFITPLHLQGLMFFLREKFYRKRIAQNLFTS